MRADDFSTVNGRTAVEPPSSLFGELLFELRYPRIRPGKYSITLTYSLDPTKDVIEDGRGQTRERWSCLDDEPGTAASLARALVTTRTSNAVTIEVVEGEEIGQKWILDRAKANAGATHGDLHRGERGDAEEMLSVLPRRLRVSVSPW